MRGMDIARQGLCASLLIRHPETKKIFVNFDPEVIQLFSETRHMKSLDLEIPQAAVKIVGIDQAKLKFYADR